MATRVSPSKSEAQPTAKGRSLASRLYRGETSFQFIGHMRRWFILSSVIILAGLVSIGIRGLNFGIDFRGGTSFEFASTSVTVGQVKAAIAPLGFSGATIEVLGSGKSRTIEVQSELQAGTGKQRSETAVADALAKLAHLPSANAVSISDVGPSWGSGVTDSAIKALIAFLVAIIIYISIRFEWKMAISAIIAVVHDILVTVGVYSLSGLQVTPDTVIAVLTILGYSLYDTIVVFDRVQENVKGLAGLNRLTYSDSVNLSMNQVLMRSINTSLVAILPILSVLLIGAELLGATTLQEFGFALTIGLLSGAYSSIFIASPLLCVFKEREKRYRELRQRLGARAQAGALLSPAAAAAAGLSGSSLAAGGVAGPAGRGSINRLGGRPGPLKPGVQRSGSARPGTGTATQPASGEDGAAAPAPAPASRPRPPANRRPGGRPGPKPRKKGRKR
jgi:preprotein translocase subunit SecF